MTILLAAACWVALGVPCWGQFTRVAAVEGTSSKIVTQQWRVGLIITAEGGAFRSIVGTTTVPMDWPEQRVRTVKEDLSPGVTLGYHEIKGVARQMVVKIPELAAGEEAKAIVTFEARRLLQTPPEATDDFVLTDVKRSDAKLSVFLAPSPQIESNAREIVETAKKIGADKEKAWEIVEAVYDWVREKVEFQDNRGGTVQGALATLRDGAGDCDEMTALFVALCRAKGIPARMVRVPGHCYPEFYLQDRDGKGKWFPCQAAGTRALGGMPDPRPVLQKGDNVSDPRSKKAKVRFLPETLVGFPVAKGVGKLSVKLICEPVEK